MANFLIGFVIGAAIGVAVVVITAPRSGSDTRQGINATIQNTLDAGRQATADRERELWADFRKRLPAAQA